MTAGGPSAPATDALEAVAVPRNPPDMPDAPVTEYRDRERVDRILAIAREVLAKPDITADEELADHGGTSLSIVRIVAVASRMLDVDINPRDLDGTVTARNLARVARQLRPA